MSIKFKQIILLTLCFSLCFCFFTSCRCSKEMPTGLWVSESPDISIDFEEGYGEGIYVKDGIEIKIEAPISSSTDFYIDIIDKDLYDEIESFSSSILFRGPYTLTSNKMILKLEITELDIAEIIFMKQDIDNS